MRIPEGLTRRRRLDLRIWQLRKESISYEASLEAVLRRTHVVQQSTAANKADERVL